MVHPTDHFPCPNSIQVLPVQIAVAALQDNRCDIGTNTAVPPALGGIHQHPGGFRRTACCEWCHSFSAFMPGRQLPNREGSDGGSVGPLGAEARPLKEGFPTFPPHPKHPCQNLPNKGAETLELLPPLLALSIAKPESEEVEKG